MASLNARKKRSAQSQERNVMCFVVDTTQSMQNWISAVRTVLGEVVDLGTLTHAFDAVAVMEYGDYDSVWCSQAKTTNTYGSLAANGIDPAMNKSKIMNLDDIPIRFSGWGLIGAEVSNKNAVVDENARVSVDTVHAFASDLKARGGGRVPEAVKTALTQLAYICSQTLSDTSRVHVLHLTDAPLHMDMRGLDGEGLKEKAFLLGLASATVSVNDAPTPFSTMAIYKKIIDVFAVNEAVTDTAPLLSSTTEESIKEELLSDPQTGVVLLPPSRLRYTCVCEKPLVSGPYAVLAYLTGGNVVAPANVEVGTLRDTILSILNAWMGVADTAASKAPAAAPEKSGEGDNSRNVSSSSFDALSGSVCHLLFKTKPAVQYTNLTTPAGRKQVQMKHVAAIPFDLSDSKLDALCKCRRHDVWVKQLSTTPSHPTNIAGESLLHARAPTSEPPSVTIEIGLKRALKRCLALLKNAAGAGVESSKVSSALAREAYMEEIATVLRRLCRTSPMALCSSPPLGRIWRAFTRRRDDPRRDEFLALLQNSARALKDDDKSRMDTWLAGSFDNSNDIVKELKAFVAREGVKGLVVYDGAEGRDGFIPRSLTNAFMAFDKEAQRDIMAILVRMRVDAQFSFALPSQDADWASQQEVAEEQEANGDDDLVDETDTDTDEENEEDTENDPFNNHGLPFPANAIPLNLPPATLFRLLMSIAVPGTQLTRRPAALVATLALRSGSVLRSQAAAYLYSICGRWLSFQMGKRQEPAAIGGGEGKTSDEKGLIMPPPSLTPLYPENFVAAFMRTLLSTQATLDKNADNNDNDDDDAENNHSANKQRPAGKILSWAEHKTLQKLLRLSTLLRVDSWETTASIIDVDSADGVTADYVLRCVVCGQHRPWSLVDGDGICGYCHYGRTQEGKHTFGPHPFPDPNFKSSPDPKGGESGAKKGGAKNGGGRGKKSAGSQSSPSVAVKKKASAPLIDRPPAPQPASPSVGTYQVRCGNCFGYYSRDRDRTVVGGHRCFYCRETSAPEAAEQLRRERVRSTMTTAANNKNTTSDNNNDNNTRNKAATCASANDANNETPFPHIKTCVDCSARVIGAPSRPLPNGGRCAACAIIVYNRNKKNNKDKKENDSSTTTTTTSIAASSSPEPSTSAAAAANTCMSLENLDDASLLSGEKQPPKRRQQTTTERTLRMAKLFPYRLFWRDMSSAVGLELNDVWGETIRRNDEMLRTHVNDNNDHTSTSTSPSLSYSQIEAARQRAYSTLLPQQNSLPVAAQAFDIPCINASVSRATQQQQQQQERSPSSPSPASRNPNQSEEAEEGRENSTSVEKAEEIEKVPDTTLPPNRFLEEIDRLRLAFIERAQEQRGQSAAMRTSSASNGSKVSNNKHVEEGRGDHRSDLRSLSLHQASDDSAASSNRYLELCTPQERRALQLSFNPFTAVQNIEDIWAMTIESIYASKFGGESAMCALCCDEFSHGESATKLHPTCSRKGCDQRMCYPCGKEWYGWEKNNRMGHVMAPRKLFCPCCARAPAPKVLKIHHPDAAHLNWPAAVSALNTDRYHLAACRVCTKPREYVEKSCVAATADADGEGENYVYVNPYANNNGRRGAVDMDVTDYVCTYCIPFCKSTFASKKCPQCKAPTFRVDGCFHMTCICGEHWCYDCGESLDAYDPYNHDCLHAGAADGEPY